MSTVQPRGRISGLYAFMVVLGVFIVTACTSKSMKSGNSPADYGAHQVASVNKYVTYVVWSIDASETIINGVGLQERIERAKTGFGEPSKAVKYQSSPVEIVDFLFSPGLRIEVKDGRIVLIEAREPYAGWSGPRGISYGDPCSKVEQRFGPSHEGPETYVYLSAEPPRAIEFVCRQGRITGMSVSGSY